MPWMEESIKRLPSTLDRDQKIQTLTFLSCIGLIQKGDFVSFQELSNLISKLTVKRKSYNTCRYCQISYFYNHPMSTGSMMTFRIKCPLVSLLKADPLLQVLQGGPRLPPSQSLKKRTNQRTNSLKEYVP